MFRNKKGFYEKSFNEVTKKTKNRDFPPEELENLRCICVDEVHIGLQDPVQVNSVPHLASETAASSVNRRDSGMVTIIFLFKS